MTFRSAYKTAAHLTAQVRCAAEFTQKNFRVYLEDVLKARGMTSKELCKLVGITEANLSVLCSGKAKGVRFHTINRICYFLQCDVGDILIFDGNLEENDDEA